MFQKQLESLQAFNGTLRAQYIKSVKAQQLAAAQDQQATALNALDQAHLQQTQVDSQLKAMKTSATIKTNNEKALNSMKLAQVKTAADIQMKAQLHAQQVRQAASKAAAK